MRSTDRRTFLKLMSTPALAAALPASIARALEIPANDRTGTIGDVEHIVILTQENRSFDHYFGAMRGVRGFADPRAVRLQSGQSVWHQPTDAGFLLPFRPHDNMGMTFLPDPPHGWNDSHAAWNAGEYDAWVPNKGVTAMTYHTRADIPYHYALADAFTICDAYYCSVMGPTDPNRYHMWSGWVGNDGRNGGPVITNAELGYDWSTYPARLQRTGISWKVYQDAGVGLDAAGFWGWTGDPYIGNFGDNSLLYFHQYQFALPGTPLADNAKTGTNLLQSGRTKPIRLLDIFRQDVRGGRLPQVSWIAAPEAYSEHPNWPANYGAWYMSQFIDALTSNPEVWSKTVLFINYDEAGGFFDHAVPPTPPASRAEGLSTVDLTNEIFPGDFAHPRGPYGLGTRVPMLVVSPWSIGGWVNSQVFDHTSLIRFIEARFAHSHRDLIETNITPWRRAVAGDLTSSFDFRTPNAWRTAALPSTSAFKPADFARHPDEMPAPPTDQLMPEQERGTRPARSLPYELNAIGAAHFADGSFRIDFVNSGQATAVFQVRSGNSPDAPRSYTVEPHKQLSDVWHVTATGAFHYDLSVYGPNGFLRAFKGGVAGHHRANLDVQVVYEAANDVITLTITNRSTERTDVSVVDQYTGRVRRRTLEGGAPWSRRWSLENVFGWYDFAITVDGDPGFAYQLAGHVENGEDSVSDPGMGRMV
jgi:phospholipase C